MNNGKVTVEGVKMTDAKLRSGTKCRSERLFTKGQRSGTSKGKLVSFWYCAVLYCTVPLTHLGKAARRHRHPRSSRQSREEAHPHTNTCTVLYLYCTVRSKCEHCNLFVTVTFLAGTCTVAKYQQLLRFKHAQKQHCHGDSPSA